MSQICVVCNQLHYKDQVKLSMDQHSRGFSEDDQPGFDEPRQVASSSLSPQKTKKIGKKGGRPSKKQKPQKRDPPDGQGSQNDQRDTDPCEDTTQTLQVRLMMILIDFFDQTSQKKGFVYTNDTRKRYNNKLDKGSTKRWNKDIVWKKEVELQKARIICRREEGLTEVQVEVLVHAMVESSAIFAEEFTEEYYEILLKVYMMTRREKEEGMDDAQMKELCDLLANDIFINNDGLYHYFSFTFRTFRIDNDSFRKPTSNKPYKALIDSLRSELINLP